MGLFQVNQKTKIIFEAIDKVIEMDCYIEKIYYDRLALALPKSFSRYSDYLKVSKEIKLMVFSHAGIVSFDSIIITSGHIGIDLIGAGTARIGDPSGKTEMRKMISYEEIDENVTKIEAQLDRFIGFDGKTAMTDNNKNWLANLNYIDFLRDIGSCFSVNKMLTFEADKQRLERGLSFIEFNYQ